MGEMGPYPSAGMGSSIGGWTVRVRPADGRVCGARRGPGTGRRIAPLTYRRPDSRRCRDLTPESGRFPAGRVMFTPVGVRRGHFSASVLSGDCERGEVTRAPAIPWRRHPRGGWLDGTWRPITATFRFTQRRSCDRGISKGYESPRDHGKATSPAERFSDGSALVGSAVASAGEAAVAPLVGDILGKGSVGESRGTPTQRLHARRVKCVSSRGSGHGGMAGPFPRRPPEICPGWFPPGGESGVPQARKSCLKLKIPAVALPVEKPEAGCFLLKGRCGFLTLSMPRASGGCVSAWPLVRFVIIHVRPFSESTDLLAGWSRNETSLLDRDLHRE